MAAKQRKPGWWYPWIFVGGMLVVIAVNGIMITLALDSFTGVEKDAYRKGIHYNEALAGAQAQAALGWKLDHSFVPDGNLAGEVRARFRGRDGLPMNDLEVKAYLIRPVQDGYDFEVALPSIGDGAYAARIALPLKGQWTVRIHAWRGDDTFQEAHKIMVQ